MLEAFRRDYPKSKQQADVTQKLAVAYMESGRSDAAAGEFERIAQAKESTPEVRLEALNIAAGQYEKSGNTAKTVALLEKLVAEYPTPVADRIETRQKLADFVGELGWNRRLSVDKNAAAMNPNADRDSANLRMIFEPKYRQVLPGVDLSVPVGVGYGFIGNSSVVGPFLGKGTGDLSLGLNGSYRDVWRFGLAYTHYFGEAAPFIEGGHRSFLQSNADRNFLSFNVRRSF